MATIYRDATRQVSMNEWAGWTVQKSNEFPRARWKYPNLTPNIGVLEVAAVKMGESERVVETFELRFLPNGFSEPVYLNLLLPDSPARIRHRDNKQLDSEFTFVQEMHDRAQANPTRRGVHIPPIPRMRIEEGKEGREYYMQTIMGRPLDDFFRYMPSFPDRKLTELIVLHNAYTCLKRHHDLGASHGDARFANLLVNPQTLNVTLVDPGKSRFVNGEPNAQALYHADIEEFMYGIAVDGASLRAIIPYTEDLSSEKVEIALKRKLAEKGYNLSDLPHVQAAVAKEHFRLDLQKTIFNASGIRFGEEELDELIQGINTICDYARRHPESFGQK